MKNIEVKDLLESKEIVPIDVRSPSEYREDTVPGAKSIPLFDDEERSLVGKIYHEEGDKAARKLGLKIVSPKLNKLVDEIIASGGGKPVCLFCWRGGLRSRSLVQMLDLVGYPSYRLEGGYKAYRKYIHSFLNESMLPMQVIVLYGLTGVGKTEIIKELQNRELAAIDLEGLACHRGSVFGSVGLKKQPSQKAFDTKLYLYLIKYWQQKYLIVEGESRRIGRLYLPDCLYTAMKNGIRLLVYDKIENRVKRIIKEYTYDNEYQINKNELNRAISNLSKRIGNKKTAELQMLINEGEFAPVVKYLLEKYYDLLYKHPDVPDSRYMLSVSGENIKLAVDELEAFLASQGMLSQN